MEARSGFALGKQGLDDFAQRQKCAASGPRLTRVIPINGQCGYQFRPNVPRLVPSRSFEGAWDRVVFV